MKPSVTYRVHATFSETEVKRGNVSLLSFIACCPRYRSGDDFIEVGAPWIDCPECLARKPGGPLFHVVQIVKDGRVTTGTKLL
jgi:hypothetical protein